MRAFLYSKVRCFIRVLKSLEAGTVLVQGVRRYTTCVASLSVKTSGILFLWQMTLSIEIGSIARAGV